MGPEPSVSSEPSVGVESSVSPDPAGNRAAAVFRLLLLLVAAAAIVFIWLEPASAVPEWRHANAQNCNDCHHTQPVDSFAPCEQCHPDPAVPNQYCQDCHTNKANEGIECWDHHAPGQDMPPPTIENCIDCHTANPHPFSELGDDPACTVCHSTSPTPHHDGEDQMRPETCTDCHTTQTHNGVGCTSCHSPERHPSFPEVPQDCFQCHAQATFGERPQCLSCHSITGSYSGFVDDDIHDETIPDAPISATSCRSCHPQETHAGQLECVQCHDEATPFHHGTSETAGQEVPEDCFRCHDRAVFGGRPDCAGCHTARGGFAGQTDEDIHDASLPDAPISSISCRSCHPQAQKHAGQVACLSCHTEATAFHHNTAASAGFPACQTCHGNKPQHGRVDLDCQRCHVEAHHQIDPPTPGPVSCTICHDVPRFAVNNCYGCHRPPIYHIENPQVPGCNAHHGPFEIHDGLQSCEQCHTNPAAGHHRGDVVIPDCRSCHEQEYHVGRIACSSCHRNAAHDRTPLNLPTPVWDVCLQCHPFAARAPACNECHDETQHSATYRVPDCGACHDQSPHAGRVDCRLCHTRIESGHHNDGEVQARECSACHITAEVHAADTTAGAEFTCATCHEGGVHGPLSLPDADRCLDCHEEAEEHSGDLECIQCHWPAAHAGTPVAGEFGSYEPLELRLPAPTGDDDVDERAEFTFTGLDLIAQLALGLGLLLIGLLLRAMSAAEIAPLGPADPDPDDASEEDQ